jgi:uncharacterized protein YjiS (DUF1127 family)
MKHFQFAIASIVDANTGYGLVHGGDSRDTTASERHARAIRARSLLTVLGGLRGYLSGLADAFRTSSIERRAIAQLSQLNDHYLEDIGLTRGDIGAVETGQASLADLNENRRARLAVEARVIAPRVRKIKADAVSAVNEDSYVEAKSA